MSPRRGYALAVVTALLSSNAMVEGWKTISFVQFQRICSSQNKAPRPQRTVSSRILPFPRDGSSTSLYAHHQDEVNSKSRRTFLAASASVPAAVLASLFLPAGAAKALMTESSGYPFTPSPLPTSVKTAAELASFSSSSSRTKHHNQAKSDALDSSDLLVSSDDLLADFGKKLSGQPSSSSSSQYPFTPSPLPTSVKSAKELTDSFTTKAADDDDDDSLARPSATKEGTAKELFPLSLQDFVEEASRQKQIEPLTHGV